MRLLTTAACVALLAGIACNGDDDNPDAAAADASEATDANGQDAGTLGFMDECDMENDLCDSSDGLLCWDYPSKGPHCTRECDGPEDCEEPSPGCNSQGVCRAP